MRFLFLSLIFLGLTSTHGSDSAASSHAGIAIEDASIRCASGWLCLATPENLAATATPSAYPRVISRKNLADAGAIFVRTSIVSGDPQNVERVAKCLTLITRKGIYAVTDIPLGATDTAIEAFFIDRMAGLIIRHKDHLDAIGRTLLTHKRDTVPLGRTPGRDFRAMAATMEYKRNRLATPSPAPEETPVGSVTPPTVTAAASASTASRSSSSS